MQVLLALACTAGALALLGWLLKDTPSTPPDPNDARDVGFMTGMLGGDIEDAFIARHALERAAEERKRK